MHEIQKKLLSRLRNEPSLSYADLTRGYNADDNVVFHLRRMLEAGCIAKNNGKYILTVDGVKGSSNFDLSTLDENMEKQVVFGILLELDGKFLIKKHDYAETPFINLPSGIAKFGISVNENIENIVSKSIGKTANIFDLEFNSLHMKSIVNKDKEVIFDDLFTVYSCKIKAANFLLPDNMHFMSKDEIIQNIVRWPEIDKCILGTNWSVYSEYEIQSDYIL